MAKATLVPAGAMGNSQLISGYCDDSCTPSGKEYCIFQTSFFTPLLNGLKKMKKISIYGWIITVLI